jgi:two-component system response regulator AtoC
MKRSPRRKDPPDTLAAGPDSSGPGVPGPALIIAKDPTAQRDLAGLLTSLGYRTVIAESAGEAKLALEDRPCAFTLLAVNGKGHDLDRFLGTLPVDSARTGPVIAVSRNENGPASLVGPLAAEIARRGREGAGKHDGLRHARARSTGSEDRRAQLDEEMALWCSPPMQEIRDLITLIAGVDVAVLVCGETGTGKDVVARSIHHLSARHTRPFVKVNCAALPRDLLESELFGHERGAFTGAHELKIGQFERANHGTIFLDEIGDLHPDLQGKLLHVLQDGQFSRVGGRATIKVDVRVLAATNQDLERNVAAGTFREDLLYRLNVIQIAVPPLRERLEEIPVLAQYFVHRYCQAFGREPFTLTSEVVQRLMRHRYAGNVRELENIVKRMIVLNDPYLAKNGRIPLAAIDPPEPPAAPVERAATPLKEIARRAAQNAEREAILETLEQTNWNRLRAARLLKISYRALLYKIKKTGIGSHGRGGDRP